MEKRKNSYMLKVAHKHWNNHLICAIHCKTWGKLPWYGGILEIGIVPLDVNYGPNKNAMPLHLIVKPPDNCKALNKNQQEYYSRIGYDAETVKGLFYSWFDKQLGLNDYDNYMMKKIIPLGCHWPTQQMFLHAFFNDAPAYVCEVNESEDEYFMYFHDHLYRDISSVTQLRSDWQAHYTTPVTDVYQTMTKIISANNIPTKRGDNSLTKAVQLATCYQRQLNDMRMF